MSRLNRFQVYFEMNTGIYPHFFEELRGDAELHVLGIRVTNVVSYGPDDELLLTYGFANGSTCLYHDTAEYHSSSLSSSRSTCG
jgi:hypothetical protein